MVWLNKIKTWIRVNRLETILLVAILLTGAYMRLYRISEYMTFLGDEGRDAIVVRRLLVDFDPILVGPGTSIGNMYLGPLYYYMMAPALLLANFSPVGPAIMIALLGIATIFFVWVVVREWFPTSPRLRGTSPFSINFGALFAAGLYAVSPVVIIYSRSSWKPNIMPFFSLLTIYSIWKWSSFVPKKDAKVRSHLKWLIITGISMAFVLQSHYLGLLLIPTIVFFWLLANLKFENWKLNDKWKMENGKFLRYSLIGLIFFAGLMSPLVLFDARHGWRNFSAIKTFFLARQTTVSARPWTSLPKLPEITTQVVTRLITGTNDSTGKLLTVVFGGALLLLALSKIKNIKKDKFWEFLLSPATLIFIWTFSALVGFGVYKQHIYDHYFGVIFAAPFIIIGGLSQFFIRKYKFAGTIFVFLIACYLLLINIQNSPLKGPPNRQLQRTEEVANKIIDKAGGVKFNLAVLAERNYEGAYQYFLERWNAPFIMIDPQRADDTIAEQLFVVCELAKENCDPTHSPKAEVANFGWSKVEDEWQVAGVIVFKLSHVQ